MHQKTMRRYIVTAWLANWKNEEFYGVLRSTWVDVGLFVRHRSSPSLGGRRFEFHGTCAYLLLRLWQTRKISEFSVPISSIHPLAVVLPWNVVSGTWRWRGLQAQVPRFLMTTTSFKDFEVDSRLFTIRIPSLLSLVASRSSLYIW